jgi:hypothetical protein
MNARKLILPVLVALACVGFGLASLPAAAAPQGSKAKQAKPKALKIAALEVGTKAGPLTLRVRAGIQSQVWLTVNGKPVRHPFETAGPKVQQIELRAVDGLRAGQNQLRLRARRAGVVSVAKRSVVVPAWALRADAGEDTDAISSLHAQVGTAPAPGSPGGELNYRWRIVERPHGGQAKLVGGARPQSALRARKPGTYVLQLAADPDTPGAPTAYDRVTVTVVPNDLPLGVALNTIGANGAITIGSDSYGANSPGSAYVVLERTTRNPVEFGVVSNDAAGIARLAGFADKYGAAERSPNYMKYMMIVSGRSGVPEAQLDSFASLMKKLGVALPSEENFVALRVGLPYSIVGIPGAPGGAATTRIPGGYSDPISGAISGYLQKNQAIDADGTPLYDYTSGAQPSFDTRAPGSDAKTNKMVINGQTYAATLPGSATAGFHLVVLESLSLRLLSNVALATNGLGNDRNTQAETAKTLKDLIEKPGGPTFFVQSIGKPKAAGPEWAGVVSTLTRLGANPQLINALNGSSEYTFVTRNGSKAPPAEASTAYDAGPYPAPGYPPARLVGTLARSRTSNYVPNVFSVPTPANPEGTVNIALMNLAYQAPQAWPSLAPGAPDKDVAAAQKFICEALNFCQPANSCPTLRDCFWQRYGADWDLKYSVLGNVNYPGTSSGYSEATFKAVKAELLKEVAGVANVKSYLKALQEPFDRSATRSYVDLQTISQTIWDSVQRPAADNSTSWILGLIGKAVALGGFAPPPISSAAAGLAAGFGLASYLSNKQAQPILGAEIKVRSAALGSELVDRIELARKTTVGLGMLIVSDYGKLSAADKHVDTDWALPTNPEAAANSLRTASKQWFWEALIPTSFPYLIRGNGPNARNLDCLTDARGWPNQPDAFQMNATVGYNNDGSAINGIFFFTQGIGGGSSPSGQIGDEMFRPRNGPDPGLGIEKLQFFSPRVFNGKIAHAINGTFRCSVGWLPGKY